MVSSSPKHENSRWCLRYFREYCRASDHFGQAGCVLFRAGGKSNPTVANLVVQPLGGSGAGLRVLTQFFLYLFLRSPVMAAVPIAPGTMHVDGERKAIVWLNGLGMVGASLTS